MADVLVIGAGLNGLSTAVLLARDGHHVTVLERDGQSPPEVPEAAWVGWQRRGVNQFRLPHYLLPRWRHLMAELLPDVLADLVQAGAASYNPIDHMQPKHTGGRWEADERFETITARRPVLEAVLSRRAAAEPRVTIRRGETVRALLTGATAEADVPQVIGVLTGQGDPLLADLVIDCGGRHSAMPALLSDLGGQPPAEQREDCGFVYYTRHYRARTGGEPPKPVSALIQDYQLLTILTLPADNDTWAVAFVVSARDRDLRVLREPAAWEAALAQFPLAAHWADGQLISGIDVMAGIEDRIRRYVHDGRPLVTGLLAVGDAWACTNPSLGRGASIGLLHACALRDLLRDIGPDQPAKLALRWDEVTRSVTQPLYRLTLDYDRHRLAEVEAARQDQQFATDDPGWTTYQALTAAARSHPEALRGVLDVVSLLATPEQVLARPGMRDRIAPMVGKPARLPGPHRTGLLAAVTA